jgi:hypothetical protein
MPTTYARRMKQPLTKLDGRSFRRVLNKIRAAEQVACVGAVSDLHFYCGHFALSVVVSGAHGGREGCKQHFGLGGLKGGHH